MKAIAIVLVCLAIATACIALVETASSIVRGLAG